jgi:hypothetical protein
MAIPPFAGFTARFAADGGARYFCDASRVASHPLWPVA